MVPADHQYALRALVGGILVHVIDQLDPRLPTVGSDELTTRADAKDKLLTE